MRNSDLNARREPSEILLFLRHDGDDDDIGERENRHADEASCIRLTVIQCGEPIPQSLVLLQVDQLTLAPTTPQRREEHKILVQRRIQSYPIHRLR